MVIYLCNLYSDFDTAVFSLLGIKLLSTTSWCRTFLLQNKSSSSERDPLTPCNMHLTPCNMQKISTVAAFFLFILFLAVNSIAYLKQINLILSAMKKYRIFSLVTNTIYIFSLQQKEAVSTIEGLISSRKDLECTEFV